MAGGLKKLREAFNAAQTQSRKPPAAIFIPTAEDWYVPSDDRDRWAAYAGGMPPMKLTYYRDGSGEFILRLQEEHTDLLIGPTDPRLTKLGIFTAQVVGEKFYAQTCKDADLSPGAPMGFLREPDNAYDTSAVALIPDGFKQPVGYVLKSNAPAIANLLDSGQQLAVVSVRGTKPKVACDAIAYCAAAPEVLAHLVRDIR